MIGDPRLIVALDLPNRALASAMVERLGDAAGALSFADQAVALAPEEPRAATGRGVALDMLGRHSEAQQCYRDVLARSGGDRAARNDLALSLALSGKYDEAVATLAPLALSSDAGPQLRQNLAVIYGLQEDSARAEKLSRIDLDEMAAAENLALFARLHVASP